MKVITMLILLALDQGRLQATMMNRMGRMMMISHGGPLAAAAAQIVKRHPSTTAALTEVALTEVAPLTQIIIPMAVTLTLPTAATLTVDRIPTAAAPINTNPDVNLSKFHYHGP